MQPTNLVRAVLGFLLSIALVGGWQTREIWKGWLIPAKDGDDEAKKEPTASGPERVKLSPQAQKNLRLVVKEAQPTTYWRKIYLPGTVIDRPGHSDHGIPAPIAGVVTQVLAVPGKVIRAGDELFRLRLVSDSFQTSQMELYKSIRELEIVEKERKRLDAAMPGAIPPTKLLELDYQRDRLKVLIHVYRQDLQTRQLTAAQIAGVEKGEFVREVVVRMPERLHQHGPHVSDAKHSPAEGPSQFEVQELKVHLGDHVARGQILAYVADHRYLYIEGRALKQEANLLAQAAREGWAVEAEFNDAPQDRMTDLNVEFLGTTMDAAGLTLPVYIPFANPQRTYTRNGVTHRAGAYRPGQKVLLKVAVEKMPNVFVLPVAAVAREGAEAYVFQQSGDSFYRKPVHVMAEDGEVVAIESDGSIVPRTFLAQNAAAALYRALKASQSEGGGGHHHHHDH